MYNDRHIRTQMFTRIIIYTAYVLRMRFLGKLTTGGYDMRVHAATGRRHRLNMPFKTRDGHICNIIYYICIRPCVHGCMTNCRGV